MWHVHHKNCSNPATSEKEVKWRTSTVSAQNGVPQQSFKSTWFWHIPTAKRWTRSLSERFFQRKAILFCQTYPQVKFTVSSYFYSTKKSLILHVGLKNRSDRACRVVHSSLCCMFHASLCTIQSRKFCGDFHFLVTGYLLYMEMMSSCLGLLLFFLGLDAIIT